MKTRAVNDAIDLPDGLRQEFEQIIYRFEDAWQRGQPDIPPFLPQNNDRLRLAVLRELVQIDFEYRFNCGETPTADEYLVRFAELKSAEGFIDSLRGMIERLNRSKSQGDENTKRTVLGNYVLLEKIGAGGMGQIFKAIQSGPSTLLVDNFMLTS